MNKDITPNQLAAARALVGWTALELAAQSKVSVSTIRKFEAGQTSRIMPANAAAIVAALSRAGVEFVVETGKIGVFIVMKNKGKNK